MSKPQPVPNRDKREKLLKELARAQFQKELADEFGDTASVKEFADEIAEIELEIKLLSLKK